VAAVLAAAVKQKGHKVPNLDELESRFGVGLRELIYLARKIGLQEDTGAAAAVGLELEYGVDGTLGLRSHGAEALTQLTRVSKEEARLAAQALRSLALAPAQAATCQALAERLDTAAGGRAPSAAAGIFFRPTDPAPTRRKVALLAEAMEQQRTVSFEYRGPSSGSAGRVADPLSLRRDAGAWRLLGWDHQRQALRVFALDHLAKPVVTVGAFATPKGLNLAQLRARDLSLYQPSGKEQLVTMRLEKALHKELRALFKGAPKPQKGTDLVQAELLSASPQWVVRTFLPYAPQVQVLGPAAFEKAWNAGLQKLRAVYALGSPNESL
jgi:predicted DNA-binding transcriptional regulator YafY